MRYGLKQTTAPVASPLALADLKTFLRVDSDDLQDGVLYGLIAEACGRFERQTGRQLVTAGWTMTLDWFWDVGLAYTPGGPSVVGYIRNDEWRAWQERGGWGPLGLGLIRMPRNPLVSVDLVQYVDTLGTLQTLSSALYQVDATREVGRLSPAFGQTWPSTRAQMGSITIKFTAGSGPVTTVAGSVSTGSQTVTPASMVGIVQGGLLVCDPDTAAQETVTVATIGATTFTATFAKAHAAAWSINCVPADTRRCLMRVAGAMYENREASSKGDLEEAIDALIARHDSKTYA